MKSENEIAIHNKINNISSKIGLNDKNKTVLEVEVTQNPDVKSLNLINGSWENDEPWFVIDENKKLHTLVSLDTLSMMVENLKSLNQENFELKLEKIIWQNAPIDFDDVWVVAMDEVRNIAKKTNKLKAVNINLDKLMSDIKQKYSSLFIDVNKFRQNMTKLNPK